MDSKFLQSYIDDSKKLAKTIVIKSSVAAESINSDIKLKNSSFIIDDLDPSSWKYYLNISGSYHTLDEPMVITSLDTLEEITFSKESLAIHTATAKAYQFDSRYYYSLVNKYPNQVQLILGILYPCDINIAISSKDGTILSYPKYLVEEQESTLLIDLEDYIIRMLERWYIPAFNITDNLYTASFYAILYLNIFIKILNLRLARVKSSEAHSFHIREYLASHDYLDVYIPYMTLKQKLWLYRNLNYLFRNTGKVEQFKTLVQKLLTDRRIPLSEFTVRQLGDFDDNYFPNLRIRRKPVNPEVNTADKKYFELDDLYSIEDPLVYGNKDYLDTHNNKISEKLKLSLSNVLQTKDLESKMVDISDSVPFPLDEVLLYLWATMIDKGLYNAIVTFKDPKTSENISIEAKDAFIYMQYITLKSLGISTVNIPDFVNLRSVRSPKPLLAELLYFVDKSLINVVNAAVDIRNNFPDLTLTHSTSSFFNLGKNIFDECLRHWYIISHTEDLYERAYVENVALSMFETRLVTLVDQPTTVESFLTSRNLREYDYTYKEAEVLIQSIFNAATGLDIDNSKLLKNIQKAMIAIMKTLSSYTVQYITDINDSDIIPLNWSAVRLGNIVEDSGEYIYLPEGVFIVDTNSNCKDDLIIESIGNNDEIAKTIIQDLEDLSINLIESSNETVVESINININKIDIDVTYDIMDTEVSNKTNFVGLEYFNDLSDEDKKELVSIY